MLGALRVFLTGSQAEGRRFEPGLALQKYRDIKTDQYRALTSRTARSQE
jgi:hypothetical protein